MMPLPVEGRLAECLIDTNCVLVEWEFGEINQAYQKLIGITSELPRTIILERTNEYWHAVCRSLIFRFPDDLEILKLPQKRIIQVRSASRVGIGDLGVNKDRVNNLYKKLVLDKSNL